MVEETYTREQLLALTPAQYLHGGYFESPDASEPRSELHGTYALASAERLNRDKVPDDLLDQVLDKLRASRDKLEASGVLAKGGATFSMQLPALRAIAGNPAYRKFPALAELLKVCLDAVKTPRDMEACIGHLDKVNMLAALNRTLYEINVGLKEGRGFDEP